MGQALIGAALNRIKGAYRVAKPRKIGGKTHKAFSSKLPVYT